MNYKSVIKKIYFVLVLAMLFVPPVVTYAQSTQSLNPFLSTFQLSTCDGPKGVAGINEQRICDFKGLINQIKFLINAMIILGLLLAIAGFTYAGFLYMTGEQAKIKQAKEILQKTLWGLVMMLSAWFIVVQLLTWLVNDNTGARTLLGA